MHLVLGWMEAMGLLLVLFSSFVKIFFGDALADLHRATLRYRLEEKVDYLFMIVSNLHRNSGIGDAQNTVKAINLDDIEQRWGAPNPETQASQAAGAFNSWETYAFILGSLLLAAVRILPLVMPSQFEG